MTEGPWRVGTHSAHNLWWLGADGVEVQRGCLFAADDGPYVAELLNEATAAREAADLPSPSP